MYLTCWVKLWGKRDEPTTSPGPAQAKQSFMVRKRVEQIWTHGGGGWAWLPCESLGNAMNRARDWVVCIFRSLMRSVLEPEESSKSQGRWSFLSMFFFACWSSSEVQCEFAVFVWSLAPLIYFRFVSNRFQLSKSCWQFFEPWAIWVLFLHALFNKICYFHPLPLRRQRKKYKFHCFFKVCNASQVNLFCWGWDWNNIAP